MSNNSISDLEDIDADWRHLESINLESNSISALRQLYKVSLLPNLNSLVLSGNPIEEIDGYRSVVIFLVPKLEALDRRPITNEERSDADKNCRRSFAFLPTVIQNLTNITIFKRMLEHLQVN